MRPLTLAILALLLITLVPCAADAQIVVHDPVNYIEIYASRLQLVQQLNQLRQQAQRLAQSKLLRYRTPEIRWRTHDFQFAFPYARPYLTALNYGDAGGAMYLSTVDPLRAADTALARLPFDQRRRATAQLASIELADSAAQMAIHQIGAIRYNGRTVLQAIQDLETDTVSGLDADHTQVAVLNKINASGVLTLRAQQNTNQLLMHLVEQLLADAKRQRDAEAQHVNSRLVLAEEGETFYRQVFGGVARQLAAGSQ